MPQSGISVGSDARFDILTPAGALALPTLLSFDAKKITEKKKINPLNGLPINLQFGNGWEGTFQVARADGTLDDYFAALEAAQAAGANIAPGSIHQTISNPDGTVSLYMFIGVQLYYDDAGSYKALEEVTQHVSFMAADRKKVV